MYKVTKLPLKSSAVTDILKSILKNIHLKKKRKNIHLFMEFFSSY